jgi:hypothetical protein
MANTGESLVNVVIHNELKMLTSLTKRYVIGSRVPSSLDADNTVTGGEAKPNPCMVHMRNVVNRTCSRLRESGSARPTDSIAGRG